jgi:hypothetical protein
MNSSYLLGSSRNPTIHQRHAVNGIGSHPERLLCLDAQSNDCPRSISIKILYTFLVHSFEILCPVASNLEQYHNKTRYKLQSFCFQFASSPTAQLHRENDQQFVRPKDINSLRYVQWTTSAFGDQPCQMLKVTQRFGKHCSCHLHGECVNQAERLLEALF